MINHLHRNLELELQPLFLGDTVQPPTPSIGGSCLQLFLLWEGLFQVGGCDLLIWLLLFISSSHIPLSLSTFLETMRCSRLIFSSCAFLISALESTSKQGALAPSALESTTNQRALAPFIGEWCLEVEIRALGVLVDAGVLPLPGMHTDTHYQPIHVHLFM